MVIIMEKNEIVATVRSAEGETSDSIEKTIDFTELLLFFLNKLWIIVLITCVCGAGAYFYSRFTTVPLYKSTAKIYLMDKNSDKINSANINVASSTVEDSMKLIKEEVLVSEALQNLALDISYSSVSPYITVTNESDSLIINVSVSNADPKIACAIVNELCDVSTEKIKNIIGIDQVNVFSYGKEATAPSNLAYSSTALKAALVGFALTCAVLFVIFYFDDKIKSPADIEHYLGLTVLGTIPNSKKM